MDCMVIGAGVAGIAASQGLRRIGARVTLLERDRAPRETGFQLGIFGNGRYAQDRLGCWTSTRKGRTRRSTR
jgi:2-polyprenyl-6-methoxyphenol hydroxylase-like FAD-dependent oxidoreductase